MKRSTYNILTKLPIVGVITKSICDPVAIRGSLFLQDNPEFSNKIIEYSKQHPDIQITKKVVNDILSRDKHPL